MDVEERKDRFLKRAKSRNQDEFNALKHWEYIKSAGQKYLIPNKKYCDIILNGGCDLNYFQDMVMYINLITNNFYEE